MLLWSPFYSFKAHFIEATGPDPAANSRKPPGKMDPPAAPPKVFTRKSSKVFGYASNWRSRLKMSRIAILLRLRHNLTNIDWLITHLKRVNVSANLNRKLFQTRKFCASNVGEEWSIKLPLEILFAKHTVRKMMDFPLGEHKNAKAKLSTTPADDHWMDMEWNRVGY